MHPPVYRRSAPALALLAAFAAAGLVSNASAQTLTKANNGTSLQFAASWVENRTPTTSDTLVFDNTLNGTSTTANTTDISVFGINFTAVPVSDLARPFTIGVGGGGTISIGAGGITKAQNTSQFQIAAPIALTANQTWTINATTGTGTGFFAIQNTVTDNGHTANVSGTGRLDITGGNTFTIGNGVNLDTASVVVNSATVVVTLGNANQTNQFQVANGRAIGSVLGNFGEASSFGDGGTNTAIFLGGGPTSTGNPSNGILDYNGASVSSNRTFNFDRRSPASEIRNSNASSTLTLSGNISNSQGTFTGASAIAFGGVGNITLIGTEQIKDNTNGAGSETTLNKNGTGTLTITGANSNSNTTTGTFQGATNVNAGLLVVSGTGSINSTSGINVAKDAGFIYDSSTALTKAVTLAADSRFGGDGLVNTNINIGSGVKFVFDPSKTLDLTGTLTLADTFGLDDLVNAAGTSVVWSSIDLGTYTLVNSTTSISFTTISNLGFENLLSVTADKNAYFQLAGSNSDLQLVVSAIPEPSTYAAFAGLGALGLAAFRRRRRA